MTFLLCLPPAEEANSSRSKDSVKIECVRWSSVNSTTPFSPSCCNEPSVNCLPTPEVPLSPRVSPLAAPLETSDACPVIMVARSPPISAMSISNDRPLRVKRGYKDMSATLTCGVLFEADPVWLWSMRINSWSILFLTGGVKRIRAQSSPPGPEIIAWLQDCRDTLYIRRGFSDRLSRLDVDKW